MPKKSAKKTLISGDMLIGDVLNYLPEAAQIMQDFGLQCINCSVNVFESLKMGALSHGIEEELVDEMIKRLNDSAQVHKNIQKDGIYMTEFAAKKVKEFAKEEKKEGFGLKITAHCEADTKKRGKKGQAKIKKRGGTNKCKKEPAYAMDFQKKAGAGEKTFTFHGVEIFLDPESLKNLAGARIDFLETPSASGFKITNPRFSSHKLPC